MSTFTGEDLAPEEIDTEAPYGRRADGTPYKRSPEHRAKLATHLRQNQPGFTKSTAKATGKRTIVDYRPALTGIAQILAMGFAQAARSDPAFELDAIAVTLHAPPIVQALQTTAENDPKMSRLLDKICTLGPYGLVLTAVTPLIMQIGANHKWIPVAPEVGLLSGEQLYAMAKLNAPAPEPAPEA